MSSLLIRQATVLTMNDRFDVVEGDVLVRAGRITAVGEIPGDGGRRVDRVIDAAGAILLPGFVQTHVHLCQTIFRGLADDRPLLDWLRQRVWPLEAAHTPASLRASARLAATELLLGGTTSVLTMETVHETDAVFEALEPLGIRATVGKCLMDLRGEAPARLSETARSALDESLALRRAWEGAAGGRLRVAFAPRFAISCTRELLEGVASLSASHESIVHTHASESRAEIAAVRGMTGLNNMAYLADVGLASPRLCAAHCVWVDEDEQRVMAERGVKVLHCPGSNLKLGSGLAPVVELRARGIGVSLGADGAACNNRLDMFDEMRLAATLQAVRCGPGSLTARDVVWMATREGARALGLDREIGSIEPGKRADLAVVDLSRPHVAPGVDPYSTLVYAARGTDVRTVLVDGEVLVDDFAPTRVEVAEVVATARDEARALALRAGL
jgi:5-methylthioadenosine/S-adenosylhomocysteine deaminase